MTHFNHEWDTTKTPAVPVSVGDRYYAQDLNDDFNYLKHLPYEVFLQGRSRGVMVTPNDAWDNDTNNLTLSGGFGVILQDHVELDPDEDFVIPPKTHSSPRYERIPFVDTVLVLPNDNAMHYIVATPTKRSLLQRTKAIFTEQYASRVRYDGVIAIQDTAPTTGQILVGLCHDKEYCLLIDNNPDQCKDNIILKKWFGHTQISQIFIPTLQSYYDTTIDSIETKISINSVSSIGIGSGTFNNCIISIDTAINKGIGYGTFNNCNISINTVNYIGIGGGNFNDCDIAINTTNYYGIDYGTFNNCAISIGTVGSSSRGINSGAFNNCNISINTTSNRGINGGTFKNCIISINAVNGGYGVYASILNNCIISIGAVSGNSSRGVCDNILNDCIISINTVGSSSSSSRGINGGTLNNCTISINTVNYIGIGVGTFNNCDIAINTTNGDGIGGGTFNNCTISIDTVNSDGIGIDGGTLNNCTISIGTVGSDGIGVQNAANVMLYLTRVSCSAVNSLSNTSGKLNILNNTVLHAS